MKLVHRVEVVCQMGVSSYYKGRELECGVVDRIEDHSWEHVDGTVDYLILMYSGDNVIGKIVGAPMVIEYGEN